MSDVYQFGENIMIWHEIQEQGLNYLLKCFARVWTFQLFSIEVIEENVLSVFTKLIDQMQKQAAMHSLNFCENSNHFSVLGLDTRWIIHCIFLFKQLQSSNLFIQIEVRSLQRLLVNQVELCSSCGAGVQWLKESRKAWSLESWLVWWNFAKCTTIF